MTNVNEDGEIVPLHNDVKMPRSVSLDSLLELLMIYPLGYGENVETHLYRFYPEAEPETGTVEWSSMDNNQYNVFVPDYPVLMTDTWKGYRTGLQLTRLAARQETATGEAARMAEEAQNLALSLYRHIVYGEALTDD